MSEARTPPEGAEYGFPWDGLMPGGESPEAGDDAIPGAPAHPGEGLYAGSERPPEAVDLSAIPGLLDPVDATGLAMERKLPRGLHLWFASALGVLALLALGAQDLLRRTTLPAAGPGAVHGSPLQDAEPSLAGLQRELAREKGESPAGSGRAPAPPLGQPASIRSLAPTVMPAAAWAAAGPGAAPAGPDLPHLPAGPVPSPAEAARQDAALPEDLLAPSLAASGSGPPYEQARAEAMVAGSRILALNHAASESLAGSADGLGAGLNGSAGMATAPGSSAVPLRTGDRLRQLADLAHAAPELLRLVPDLLAAGRVALPGGTSALSGSALPSAVSAATPAAGTPVLGPPAAAPLLFEGTPIACVLLTELRSDLPGMIVAQVAEDVFDSVTAQRLLIPRGTRLIGRYESQVASGQQRLLASFHRLTLPDGASVELQRVEAADQVGSAGLHDQVDTHFWQRFGQSFLTAGLARAAERSNTPVGSTVPGGILPGPDATGQILVDTARTGLQMSAGLAPTLIIRRGTVFNVMVNRDLVLPERGVP